jgi:hypothetical protein
VKRFIVETPILIKLRYYKRSAVISVSCNEAKTSEVKRIEVFLAELSNSQRILEIIPRSGGFNTPKLALGY